jgi:hypothetical protein
LRTENFPTARSIRALCALALLAFLLLPRSLQPLLAADRVWGAVSIAFLVDPLHQWKSCASAAVPQLCRLAAAGPLPP